MKNLAVALGFVLLLGGVIYTVSLYKNDAHQESKRAYTNEIKKLQVDVNNVEVKKTEESAKKAFVAVEKNIKRESNITRSYTKKMMEDKDVTSFDDSF